MEQVPGFYGKLPSHGDFVSRRLASSFVSEWDAWLQLGVAESKARLGDDWLDTYLTSPIWRFGLTSGICGPEAWAGVVMPSVDKVGRYFPLTLAVNLPDSSSLAQAACQHEEWFERAEALALTTLGDDGFELEQFSQDVSELGPMEMPADVREVTDPGLGDRGEAWHLALLDGAKPAAKLAGLNDILLRDQLERFSLFWTKGSRLVKPSLLICRDLPPSAGFASMLGGDWKLKCWSRWSPSSVSDNDSDLLELVT